MRTARVGNRRAKSIITMIGGSEREVDLLKLLCVTAHPDDEVGGFGGSLLKYAEKGVATHVICMTPGQAATHRGGAKSNDELAEMRRNEFAASCKILKVSHGEVLNYPDAGLDHVDFYEAVGTLVRRIREIRPQVMLTMGPEGAMTAHPDHSMASIFATMAYHWAGRSNRFIDQLEQGLKPHRVQKLYYATANFTIPDRQPVALAPTTAVIDIGDRFEIKIQAFAAHTSQNPLLPIFTNALRHRSRQERFHLVASTKIQEIEHEDDLFAGVSETGEAGNS